MLFKFKIFKDTVRERERESTCARATSGRGKGHTSNRPFRSKFFNEHRAIDLVRGLRVSEELVPEAQSPRLTSPEGVSKGEEDEVLHRLGAVRPRPQDSE